MELYFLDDTFTAISAPVDTAVSVVWALRYHECGTFTAVFPLTDGGSAAGKPSELLLLAGQAVYLCDRQHCGRIESVLCREGMIQLEGRLLECLLYDRVAAAGTAYSGTVEEAVQAAAAQWAGDLSLAVVLPETETAAAETLAMEAGEVLGQWLHSVLARYGMSYTVTLTDGALQFALAVGTDRSLDSAAGVSRAIFSEEFGNIASLEEELYREDVCTRIYIEGGDGTVVTVEKSDAQTGRRERYRKAADIRAEDFETEEDYRTALVRRGEELLAECGERLRLSCTAEYDAGPRYGTDYRLGDICEMYSPAMAIRTAVRLTALDIVHEGGTVRLYPYFGDSVVRLKTALA